MPFIVINRQCDDCEKTRAALESLRSEHRMALLEYQSLYDKVRTNLGKLAKRAKLADDASEAVEQADPMTQARQMLIERKLKRGA